MLPLLLPCVWSYLFSRVSFVLGVFLFDGKVFSQSALNPTHPFARGLSHRHERGFLFGLFSPSSMHNLASGFVCFSIFL